MLPFSTIFANPVRDKCLIVLVFISLITSEVKTFFNVYWSFIVLWIFLVSFIAHFLLGSLTSVIFAGGEGGGSHPLIKYIKVIHLLIYMLQVILMFYL